MKKTLFTLFAFIAAAFLSTQVWADKWFICLGSFTSHDNAIEHSKYLTQNNVPNFIYHTMVNKKEYYRVLKLDGWENKTEAAAHCEQFKNSNVVQKKKIKNIWICEIPYTGDENPAPAPLSPSVPAPAVAPAITPAAAIEPPHQEIILETNTKETLPVSEEKPYSILVKKYKEEKTADNDCHRLEAKDIDAYVIKTYDEDEYFNFNLHAGAFETPEQAEPLQEQLAEIGIKETTVSDYNTIKPAIEKYDEVVNTEKVVYQTGNSDIPEMLSPQVKKLIRQFPINRNFEIETILVADLDNARSKDSSFTVDYEGIDKDNLISNEAIHALTLTKYNDNLFGKSVYVLMMAGDTGAFGFLSETEGTPATFRITGDILESRIYEQNGVWNILGFNPDKSLAILMLSNDFSENEFQDFILNFENDSSLLIYPQIRKSLLVLPDNNPKVTRDFIFFRLSKVSESYAAEKNYAKWAIPIVGHWEAEGFFVQENENLEISFFDMDYNYNASKIHGYFMDEKNEVTIDYNNHQTMVKNLDAWYLRNIWLGRKELSFAHNSYIVAIDVNYNSSIVEDDLIQFAEDLKIWKALSNQDEK